jgi:hypothetical protein
VLSRVLTGWRTTLVIVKPETVIAWQLQQEFSGNPFLAPRPVRGGNIPPTGTKTAR